jgi:hypothetical protein
VSLAFPARADQDLGRAFTDTVKPFVETYCVQCHAREKPKGQLDLTAYSTLDAVVRGQKQWETVLEMLVSGEMPPKTAKQHPPDEQRAAVTGWITALRRQEARRQADDPGPVLARRLSNAEYDYTIRDLTGVDIRPTREFPVDHSCLLFLSNMWSGFAHDNSKLPVVTVGGLDGTLETGRVLDYLDRGDDNRKLCSLYLSLMDRMGVPLEKFGNADARRAGL